MSVMVRNIEVGDLLGETSKFRIYLGKMSDDTKVIVKIAKTFEDNPVLVEDAKEFNMLKSFEMHLRQFAKYPCADAVNYHLLFAKLLSSFTEETQGDRRMNIYTVPEADLADMTPLPKLSSQIDIDARSSVWILGRFFKFYSMFEIKREADHDDACRYPIFSPNDYLISPRNHRLVYYNFSGEIYDVYATDIIKSMSKCILDWVVIDGDKEDDMQYYNLLKDLSENGRQTAGEAHRDLYNLVREIWGIKYYPFTYRHRNTSIWKNIEEV